ncbi:class Ib ribonucleoside-diphosphate reductase assembly flavoprotein NrdI [Paenibacillus aquistagni]|uniref:class Ib ribonucleoside-diphosphate reductase assembly flavoprotein NrdI n=1 Tax=Paenibacillus aquistagni TaxID=1852522 RepID=UPI00145AFFC8|nr:class Ib ribonucleoside-diphosphate reductase assembly flavoprotein NrdI [Paenibacillus aquistagni]NMM53121.1 class Ib ribonucleoside-diphosphate reductase assembly flavoprotein NrdI [Paenibacillus aquistagni]
MRIVFDSKTGNVKRFVGKLDMECTQITPELEIEEPYILITYTTGFGQTPQMTKDFLSRNGRLPLAVASSGNMNWGNNYGRAANLIAEQYGVPVLMKFELSGTQKDVVRFKQGVDQIVYTDRKVDTA